ncbi:MAG: ribonuclease III [Chloroflexi bacterium]|nr:ribonuclease III [Chloroflexota bacterium]
MAIFSRRKQTPQEKALGVKFKNPSLLEEALTHTSFCHENPGSVSNERLEFLGDAVLGLVVAQELFHLKRGLSEGEMTQLRAGLVSGEALGKLGSSLGLGDHLRLGKGEEGSNGRKRPSNLARAVEALMGAIYMDKGLEEVRSFMDRAFKEEWERVLGGEALDYKSRLQELLQARGEPLPRYHLLEQAGPGHARRFTIEVKVGRKTLGRGQGKSKKGAEQTAARSALERLEK